MKIYILERHDKSFLSKDLEWSCDQAAKDIFYTPFRDVALNQLVELNAKTIDLRAVVIECDADSSGNPVILLHAENANQIEAMKVQPHVA